MNLTQEQTKTLQEVLYGVTEFKHDRKLSDGYIGGPCKKCGQGNHATEPPLQKTCPIPDPINKSMADIAEDIRVWMEKKENHDCRKAYHKLIYMKYRLDSSPITRMWIVNRLLNISPLGKITAAITVYKND